MSKTRPTPEKRGRPLDSPMRHSYKDAFIFFVKVRGLQARRALQNVLGAVRSHGSHPIDTTQISATQISATQTLLAESVTPLWTEASPAERYLVVGKVHNLRVAVRGIQGVKIAAGETFSFWAQVGRTTVGKGYVAGHELREGCLVPSIGGGLCQLSNALYDAALKAGDESVLELLGSAFSRRRASANRNFP
jgi:vancomycin resistance protein YoaR